MTISSGYVADVVEASNAFSNGTRIEPLFRFFQRNYGTIDRYHMVVDRPLCPWGVIIFGPNAVLVSIGGVRDNAMRAACIAGWGDSAGINVSQGFNPWAAKQAMDHFWLAMPARLGFGVPLIMVGHSGGAMIVNVLNHMHAVAYDQPAATVITTGMPRARVSSPAPQWPYSEYFRYMTPTDPVCCLPPRFDEAPSTVLVAAGVSSGTPLQQVLQILLNVTPNPPLTVWPRFMHTPGGQTIDNLGFTYPSDLPLSASLDLFPAAQLGSNLANLFGVAAHDHAVYGSYLRQRVNKFGDIALNEDGEPDVGGDTWPSADDYYLIPVDVSGNFQTPENGGRITVASNPIQVSTIPDPSGGTMGTLYLRGELVATYATRSKARTAARYLNKFLARLPAATEVSLSGMQVGISAYLADAAVGGGVDKKPVRVVT